MYDFPFYCISFPGRSVTKAHIQLIELADAMAKGRLVADGKILMESGHANITKVSRRVERSCAYLLSLPSYHGGSRDGSAYSVL